MKSNTSFCTFLVLLFSLLCMNSCKEKDLPTTYSVTYLSGGATGTCPTQQDMVEGGNFTIASASTLVPPTGKVFKSWFDNHNYYQPGDLYTMPAYNVTFTAQWKSTVGTHSVTYSAGEGSGIVPTQTDMSEGETFLVATPSGIVAPDGKEFSCWNDGRNDYAPNSIYTMSTKDVLLTAKYVKVDVPVTYDFTPSGTIGGHPYVDMGLSVKWATTNLGGTQIYDIGNYYAWQETTPYTQYTWVNYKWTWNPCDPNNILSSIYDAARMNWGKEWKMPTTEEQQELLKPENCTWTWSDNFQNSGQAGYIVTSKSTGKSLFLAAGKYIKHETFSTPSKVEGWYWSSWAGVANMWKQHIATMCMYFTNGTKYTSNANSGDGLPIRAVVGHAPEYIPETTLPVDNNLTAQQGFTVCSSKGGKTYVDLGLPSRTMWATYNVGATTPTGYGNYYAWGETTTKDLYSQSNYKFFTGNSTSGSAHYAQYSKYIYFAAHGTCDYKLILDPEDDAATANWGSSWTMPTVEQIEELGNYCVWYEKNITVNGTLIHGHIGESKVNGNTIYLPAGGWFYESTPNTYLHAWYWSKNLSGGADGSGSDYRANYMTFDNNGAMDVLDTSRPQGLTVRAVTK